MKPRISILRRPDGTNYYTYKLGAYRGGACSFRRICEMAAGFGRRYKMEQDIISAGLVRRGIL